jgi:hypothetical protein
MPGYTPWQLGLFAHETGHFLGLRHTFVGNDDRVTDTPSNAINYILSHGGTAAALDGDNISLYPGDDPVTDTNPDPGTYYYTHYVSSDTVNGPATFTLSAGAPINMSWTFTPPRSNLMSYYNWTNQTVTSGQAAVMNKWYRMRFTDHSWLAGAYLIGNSGNGGEDDTSVRFFDQQGAGGNGGGCGCPFGQALAATAAAGQASFQPNWGPVTAASAQPIIRGATPALSSPVTSSPSRAVAPSAPRVVDALFEGLKDTGWGGPLQSLGSTERHQEHAVEQPPHQLADVRAGHLVTTDLARQRLKRNRAAAPVLVAEAERFAEFGLP